MNFEEIHCDAMIEDFRKKMEIEKIIPSTTQYTFDILILIKNLQERVGTLENHPKDGE